MNEFAGRTAVVTGAASGIGRGLVEAALARGMRVVAADVDAARLAALTRGMDAGDWLMTHETDVSSNTAVKALADAVATRFGKVHLLFNNAGVLATGTTWEQAPAEWSWLLRVNVMGVVHGIHHFLPAMLAHGEAGAVVNTASMGGLLPSAALSAYTATKYAIVGLSECLMYELQAAGAKIAAAVICPAQVRTDIMRSERLRDGDGAVYRAPELRDAFAAGIDQTGMAPRALAEIAFEHIGAHKFWVFPHPEMLAGVEQRVRTMLAGQAPNYQPMQVP